MRRCEFTVLYEPLPDGGYDAMVPAIPEICTFGETMEEARQMVEDALRCYLESAAQRNETIPQDIQQAGMTPEDLINIL